MIEPDLSLQKPLEDYVEYLEKLNVRSIPLLEQISCYSLSFQDPYYSVRGVDEAEKILGYRFSLYPNVRYKVSDFMWGRRPSTAYVFWSLRYRPQKKIFGKTVTEDSVLEGMSEIMFSPEKEIFSVSEFWGAHDAFNIRAYKKLQL